MDQAKERFRVRVSCKLGPGSRGKSAKTEGNWETDQNHVGQNALNQAAELIWPREVKCAQREHYKVHHQKYRNPIKQSAHQEMLVQKLQLPACQAVNGGRCKGNEVVQEKS